MESKRPRHHQINRSMPNGICKKHAKHQQSPGVCSICLREKLSQLSKTSCSKNSTRTEVVGTSCSSSSLSSLSSSHYSSDVSSCSSPVRGGTTTLSMIFLRAGKNVLMKSRSVAAATRRREVEGLNQGKKKRNFLSKLLRRTKSKRADEVFVEFVHSKTMRERVATRVH